MLLLNNKSIIDCDENEELLHNKEIEFYVDNISDLPNFDCAVIIKYIDHANKNKNEKILSCKLHDFIEVIEYCDIKNGIDLLIDQDNSFCIIAYGQYYTIKNDWYNVETKIQILPYKDNREFVEISSFLIDIKEKLKKIN